MTFSSQPLIPLVVAPRERFSYTRQSLESIFAETSIPFELVYVDGGSPAGVRDYLQQQAQERGFKLIRTEHYLSPNEARNIGLKHVKTPYVLFIDNDVEVTPGWLTWLFSCAEETQATVVCPLTCIGSPLHQKIHLAGGEARIVLEVEGNKARRKVHEKHYFVNRPVEAVQDQLQRRACEFAEFHCMLVRTEIFDRIGPLDKKLLSTREHIDFCLNVTQAGGTIYCEPESVVTYVPDILYRWSDLSYFMLRWSDEWERKSLKHFRKKWNLDKDKYFKKRYSRLGHRRHHAFLRPLVRKLTFGRAVPKLESMAIALERQFNDWLVASYKRRVVDHPEIRSQMVISAPLSTDSSRAIEETAMASNPH
jgi:GT2 family glycosyltransferase